MNIPYIKSEQSQFQLFFNAPFLFEVATTNNYAHYWSLS